MALLARFGGILAAFVVLVALAALGFATAQTGFLLISLLCAWPLLWAVSAWTIRGLRDNYQLVPKSSSVAGPSRRAARAAQPGEQY